MTIRFDDIIENLYKTVQKRTVLKLEYYISTIEQVELCEFE